MKKSPSDIHSGHRKRMQEKFLKTSGDGFCQHELLEMLLFYSIPRKNTNEIAHAILDRYGSLYELIKNQVNRIAHSIL